MKANKGAAGVDRCSIKGFDKDLKNNLYKIWNRMSSGCYFPPAVLRVEIPKSDGKTRPLGIPTVSDRIAQMVVKIILEPILEQIFHPDSYGYRPERSAKQAVELSRKRCWKHDWVIDLDIKGFFDNISHDLMLKALEKHTKERWILLYVKRWLKAPVQYSNGIVEQRTMGTPQGGVISPLLANLFLHYVFDKWITRKYPSLTFERYADDVIVHCNSKEEAETLKAKISQRMIDCGLELHPEKTKVIFCKDANRRGEYPVYSFDFLGFCFRPRLSKNRWGRYFVNFSPGIAQKSKKKIFAEIREWGLHRKSGLPIEALASKMNPAVRGWIEYYGAFFKSNLLFLVHHLDSVIFRWLRKKYKKLGRTAKKANHWIRRVKAKYPDLFVHWSLLRIK